MEITEILIISERGRVTAHAYDVLRTWLTVEGGNPSDAEIRVWEQYVRPRWRDVAAALGGELNTLDDTRGYSAVADAVEAVFGADIWERAARLAENEAE